MKRAASILALALTLTFAGACRDEVTSTTASDGTRVSSTTTTQPVALSPEQLGELGALIKKNPDRADQLLTQHGMTRESFEKAIRDLTEKPEDSRRYATAFKRAS